MGYNIAKKSVNSWNIDGTTVYDKYIYCDNFREVLKALSCPNTAYAYGRGSDILNISDDILFNTDDYNELDARDSFYEPKKRITLQELKKIHAENKDY